MAKHSLLDALYSAAHFVNTRWLLRFTQRTQLERWQAKQLARFLRDTLPKAPYYQCHLHLALEQLPLMDKQSLMTEFDLRNTCNIRLEQALPLAAQSERSRDFNPSLGDLTVGMSSGTSGKHALFLVSKQERLRWAGILLAKTLPTVLLKQILTPWQPPLRIAFFLRANSNLYTTLRNGRIDFRFFDLLQGVATTIPQLNAQMPQVLVAPATVLRRLADEALAGTLRTSPLHIISVAEVLETEDALQIERAFGRKPHQIYQATEGFLGYSCEHGNLHLNETHLFIEKEWCDATRTRFQPVITDFSRTTQLIVRYRLNDILRVADAPCICGRAETHIAAIEGRADEVLWLHSAQDSTVQPLYPDLLRRCMMLADPAPMDYTITQRGSHWHIDLRCDDERRQSELAISHAIAVLCQQQQVQPPVLHFGEWQAPMPGSKRKRLICAAREMPS